MNSLPDPLPMSVRAFMIITLTFFAFSTFYYASGILIPVVEALVVWFVLNAMANGFSRLPVVGPHVSRTMALIISALIALIIGILVVENTARTVSNIGPRVAGFRDALDPLVDWGVAKLGISQSGMLSDFVDNVGIEAVLTRVVSATVAIISQFSLVAIFVAFLLVDQQFYDMKMKVLLPDPKKRAHIDKILARLAESIHAYLRVMTLMSLLTTVLSYAIMRLLKIEFAEFWAISIFFLNFIPTIGSIMGTLLPTAFALLQFQQVGPAVLTFIGIGSVQFLVGNVLLPRLAGRALNISLFVTLFSLSVWGALWGVTGMFVAMPLTAIMIITMGQFDATRPIAILMSRDGDLALTPEPKE